VRQIALQIIRGERVSRIYPLLQALTDSSLARRREREVAAWALGRVNLGRALNHSDTQLVFKVLSALEKVGTSHAIPFVEKLRRVASTPDNPPETMLCPARLTMVDDPEQLLRASSSLDEG
jgi:hypothetical protein